MTAFLWLSFDPKLTWDGLLTFFGGVLAFLAILYQVKHSDRALQQQLDDEKRASAERLKQQNHALARALLSELDNFYLAYVRNISRDIRASNNSRRPRFRKMPLDPFRIYGSCGSMIGHLPGDLVASVVRAYSAAQWLTDRVRDYQDTSSKIRDTGILNPERDLAMEQLAELPDVFRGAEQALSATMEKLCQFLDLPFNVSVTFIAELGQVGAQAS